MTISTIGVKHPKVMIYDSGLFDFLPNLAKAQIASLLCSKDVIKVHMVDVIIITFQFHSGTYDCGLFSIAYATALAYRVDPSHGLFDQSRMRGHLYQCFMKRRMTPFLHSVLSKIKSKKEEMTSKCIATVGCRKSRTCP